MQQVPNYGSFLQALALKRIIESLGEYECKFINIQPGRQITDHARKRQTIVGRSVSALSRVIKYGLPFLLQQKNQSGKYYESFHTHEALLPVIHPNESVDVAIIGSDEVFNCCQPTPWGFSPQLYGDIKNARKIASYAASFGHTTYEEISSFHLIPEITESLSNLSDISVRDINSSEIITRLTGIKPIINIDPVLAYGYKDELQSYLKPYDKPYVIVYSYPGRIQKDEAEAIKSYAKRNGLRLIAIMGYYHWCDRLIAPSSPLEVLQWFKFADGIITDTFHGTIFSAITHRPFATIIRDSNRNKLSHLLSTIGLHERQLTTPAYLESILSQDTNYDTIEEHLDNLRSDTIEYLTKVLN